MSRVTVIRLTNTVVHVHSPLLHQPFQIPFPTLENIFFTSRLHAGSRPTTLSAHQTPKWCVHRLTCHFLRNKPPITRGFLFHKEKMFHQQFCSSQICLQWRRMDCVVILLLLPFREDPCLNLGPETLSHKVSVVLLYQ